MKSFRLADYYCLLMKVGGIRHPLLLFAEECCGCLWMLVQSLRLSVSQDLFSKSSGGKQWQQGDGLSVNSG